MRTLETIVVAMAFVTICAEAQDATPNTAQLTNSMPGIIETEDEKKWAFSLSAYSYFVPDEEDYVQPTIAVDHDWLHLEARYNYEDLDTSSVWVGYNFSGGKKLEWEFTPMVGGVFGDTSGIAPGYKGSLSWWKLELYSEGEYVFDSQHNSDSFFYNWSELTLAPVDWFRFGIVAQRTRTYEGDHDVERGFLAGFTYKRIDLAGYILNPDDSDPTLILSVELSF